MVYSHQSFVLLRHLNLSSHRHEACPIHLSRTALDKFLLYCTVSLLCLQPLNETSKLMSLEIAYQPISAGTLRLWVTMMESFNSLRALGNTVLP